MLEDVDESKKAISTSDEDMELLEDHFERVALYKEKGLTYFVGRS
jgi:microsomal dipeptidase-like Zn-dependent dipeptidase